MSDPERRTILVVDDSPDTLELIQRKLQARGHRVLRSGSVEEALAVLRQGPVDLVVTDLKMPGGSGMDLVRHVRENFPDTEVMMVTGYPTVAGAVRAVKQGAEEYLAKPFTDRELVEAVDRALGKLRTRRLARPGGHDSLLARYGLIGESAAVRAVCEAIRKAAASDATILVTGESGTGKELVARAIHYAGQRQAAPFVPVNCGAIPADLLESELFGHVRGSFTGAGETRAGFFQAAEGGSIFLDEVAETSLAMQVKLLRVLQDRQIAMVGARAPQTVDVRIIAATNKDLAGLVRTGGFREDLYYRLAVVTIEVPPLRERGDDVLLLARHFAVRFAAEHGRPVPVFSDAVLSALAAHRWPGNVRELENVVQHVIVMGDGPRIDVSDLPSLLRFAADGNGAAGAGDPSVAGPLRRPLAEVEASHVRRVLDSVDGNKTKAARILGIDRKTLRKKLGD